MPELPHSRALARARRRVANKAERPQAPVTSRLDRGRYVAIDALLGLEELAGLALSNRPKRESTDTNVHVVLVAERFPVPGDPLIELARTLDGARVEAAERPAAMPEDVAGLRIDYREDDGLAERISALAWLLARHPLRVRRDHGLRGSARASLASHRAGSQEARARCGGARTGAWRRRGAAHRAAPAGACGSSRLAVRVQVVDPSAYTPPYDHALCSELARQGAEVELITSRFPYGELPRADDYGVRELFYRRAFGPPGSRLRSLSKLLTHAPDMLRLRAVAHGADVVHFQWLPVQWLDVHLLPARPLVLTAHDLLPREPRPGQARAQRRLYQAVDAVVVHSEYGRSMLSARGVDPHKLHVIHHGAFAHLAEPAQRQQLPPELDDADKPVALFFGLLRPYKGLDVLLQAWRQVREGELWIVGRPRIALQRCKPMPTRGCASYRGSSPSPN